MRKRGDKKGHVIAFAKNCADAPLSLPQEELYSALIGKRRELHGCSPHGATFTCTVATIKVVFEEKQAPWIMKMGVAGSGRPELLILLSSCYYLCSLYILFILAPNELNSNGFCHPCTTAVWHALVALGFFFALLSSCFATCFGEMQDLQTY